MVTSENRNRLAGLYKNHMILVAGGEKSKKDLEKTLEQVELFLNFRESQNPLGWKGSLRSSPTINVTL